MKASLAVAVLSASWLGAIGQAPVVADPALAAAQRWIGRGLILRGFYGSNELKFDANGKVEGAPDSGDWTLAGIDLDGVKRIDAETVELDGVRVAVRYNPDNLLFERHPQKDQRVKLLVDVRKVGSPANLLLGTEPVEETLGEIFAMGLDPSLQRSMPEFWRLYFNPRLPSAGELTDPDPATVTARPILAHRTDVPETPEAEHDKVRGPLTLRLAVDEHGAVKFVSILKPIGYGLDARAVEAVRHWTFTPAQAGGHPVPMKIDLVENFAPPKPPAR